MNSWKHRIARPVTVIKVAVRDQTGAGLAEYGLLLLFIAIVSVAVLSTLGTTISNLFTQANAMF